MNALRPAMATIPNSLLLGISSPYARRGVLWQAFKENFGKENATALVWRADTRSMNSTVDKKTIDSAYQRDQASASAEYGAEFRTDVESFLSIELVEAAMVLPHGDLPPISGIDYLAFCDPSGGASDSFTLAISHCEKEKVILDVIREVTVPFQPEKVVADFCDVLKRYRCYEVVGDRYAGEWPREQFSKRGVSYKVSELTRSEIYIEMLPLFTGGVVQLPDNPRLKAQLVSLERKTSRVGKDVIDHQPGNHDDNANAAAGSLVLAAKSGHGVLGLVEYFKGLDSGEIREDGPIYSAAPGPPEQNMTCFRCSTVGMQRAGDSLICPNCGQQSRAPRVSASIGAPTPPATRYEKTTTTGADGVIRTAVTAKYPDEPEISCPECNSRTNVIGNERQCINCGKQFPASNFKPSRGQSRAELSSEQSRGAFHGQFGRFGRR